MAITDPYAPTVTPREFPPELRRFLDDELARIAQRLNSGLVLEVTGTEPRRRFNGLIVYADGVSWNPGSGEGFYGYEAGAWVKL